MTLPVITRRRPRSGKRASDATKILQYLTSDADGFCGNYYVQAMHDVLDSSEAHNNLTHGQLR